MARYNNATQHNIDYLSQLTNIPKVVCNAWIDCEGQDEGTHSPTNPLNILYYGSDRPMQIGYSANGRIARYNTVDDGLRDALSVLQLRYYAELRAIIQTKDPLKIADAIERSPWAGGNYGWHGYATGCVSTRTKWLLANDPRYSGPVENPVPTKLKVVAVVTGNERIDRLTKAIQTNLQYIQNKLEADLPDAKEKTYQPYLNRIMEQANSLATLELGPNDE